MRCPMKTHTIIQRAIVILGLIAAPIIMYPLAATGASDMINYCSAPPFLNMQAPPNVMMMLDNSGSMAWNAFQTVYKPTQFLSGYYYGYFDPTKMYKYDTTTTPGMWKIFSGTDPGSTYLDTAHPIASGNFLNWAVTKRLEVAKKLLVGGNPGYISGATNSRTVTSPSTIKLYTENVSSSTTLSFNNSTANPVVTAASYTQYLVPGYSDVIYPFNGSYSYKTASGGCSTGPACAKLSITPNSGTSSKSATILPNSDVKISSMWLRSSGTSSFYTYVDDPAASPDNDTTYLYSQNSTTPAVFGYAALNKDPYDGYVIQTVHVKVRARESNACKIDTGTTTCKTRNKVTTCTTTTTSTYDQRRIQGVLQMGSSPTTTWAAPEATMNHASSDYNQYDDYDFTWSANPVTGAPWSWDDIRTASTGSSAINGFGFQNYDVSAKTGCYADFTQAYLYIDATLPTGAYSLVVDTGQQSVTGIIDGLGSGVRFGFSTYNSSDDGAAIKNYVNFSNIDAIAKNVITMTPGGMTPLAESEYELLRYFRQDSPAFSSANFVTGMTTSRDPYFYKYSDLKTGSTSTANDKYVPCAKSYILLLTDGEPTADDFKNSSGSTVSLPTGTLGVPTDANGNGHLDELALWGRTLDMRTASGVDCTGPQSGWTFPCISGPQNIVTYTIYLFGKGGVAVDLLKKTAINGGYEGTSSSPPCLNTVDGHPTQDELKLCYRLAPDNTTGVINPATDPPLTYYEGDDAYEIQNALTESLAAIMRRSASGTAVSVLTTSSRGVGSMIQAYFLPIRQEGLREVKWTGYTQNLWLDPQDNLREDTLDASLVQDSALKLGEDKVLRLYYDSATFETMAASFKTDAAGNSGTAPGDLNSCVPDGNPRKFSDVNYLWEGGKKLALMQPSNRTIYTSSKVVHGASTTFSFGTPNYFNVTNITGSSSMSAALNPDATYTAEKIVRYVRGECLETSVIDNTACGPDANAPFRDRRVTVSGGDTYGNVWKLGDIISATPKVFGSTPLQNYHMVYGDASYQDYIKDDTYKQRSSISFIGANDGMLHAFRVGYLKDKADASGSLAEGVFALFKNFFGDSDSTNDRLGEEVWAYVPFNSFPYLKYLADTDYCHIYFNDLPVTLMDVSIEGTPTAPKEKGSWKSVLIGGMRFGGSCSSGIIPSGPPTGTPANVGFSSFYAIDITDAEHPKILWEFSDPDLGYATSFPSVLRTGDMNKNGYWYVAFGTGSKQLPKSGQDLNRTTAGYVYIVDLKTGALVKKITLDSNAIVGDVLSIDGDMNYTTEKIYFGSAMLVSSGTSSKWNGKITSIDIPNQDLTSAWTPAVHYLFSDKYPFTAAPDAVLDSNKTTWVFAGSGKYETDVDQLDMSQQVFVGFKDKDIVSALTVSNLDNRTATETKGTVSGTTTACLFSTSTNTFSIQTLVTSVTTTMTTAASAKGWYVNLSTSPTAERVISRPLSVGGLVDFLTFQPSSDVCSAGGDSYLYSLAFDTGVAPSVVSIRSPDVTSATSGNVTVKKSVKLGPGAPPKGEAIILPPKKQDEGEGSAKSKDTLDKKIQVSTGVIIETMNNPIISVTSKFLHWLRK